ncbi:hypothetical protein OTK01_000332 [Caldicellulosiruptor acetigenus]|uniref:hypothetical protein n=1 Tax=Caldicellulosiruptor acetigenus TaxID=301953 RepID=UPI0022A93CC8|nr:hypothetical protein [Caldicellulosiruptor acetigenus]WAM36558.1 hypothetical protein OTK01_000332 [Caldicellulosiruptor acetigenus]
MATVKFAEGLKEDREVLEFVERQIAEYNLDNETFEEEEPMFAFTSEEEDLATRVIRRKDKTYVIEWYTRISEYFKDNEPREFKEYTLPNGRKVKVCFAPYFPPEDLLEDAEEDEYPPKDKVLKFVLECLVNDDTPIGEEAAYYDVEKDKITAIFKRLSKDEYEIEEYYRCNAVIDKREFE